MDSRIGDKFLFPGPGFGGSCFQKDILNLVYLCEYYNLHEVAAYWEQVININNWQKDRIFKLIVMKLFGTVFEKKLAILGFSFKANTNDTRNSASIKICKNLINEGALLSIYDPKVENNQIDKDLNLPLRETNSKNNIQWMRADTIEIAAEDCHALIILTEWEEFKNISWDKIIEKMKRPAWIFDARSVIDVLDAENAGFNVWQIGNYSS